MNRLSLCIEVGDLVNGRLALLCSDARVLCLALKLAEQLSLSCKHVGQRRLDRRDDDVVVDVLQTCRCVGSREQVHTSDVRNLLVVVTVKRQELDRGVGSSALLEGKA